MIDNYSNWNIEIKPRIIYSNGICLVVLIVDNVRDDFIDIKETNWIEDGEGFGFE